MKKGYFITGTDTGVGKTFVSCTLLQAFADKGERIGAMKPIAAGCEKTPDGWQNDDALQLMRHSNVELSYQLVNPVALPPPIAPHIAIEQAGESVTIAQLTKHFEQIKDRADYFIVEGAGGWLVPLNKNESMAGIPKAFGLDVILVVGIRLGCINHALLTVDAIQQSGNQLAGWVANIIDPSMLMIEENILTLRNSIKVPLLGTIPNLNVKNEVGIAAKKLDVDFLLELSETG
jgi:dethiobiotin synthetase